VKERHGWTCATCGRAVLEYRRKKPVKCPACNSEMGDDCEFVLIVQLDASDFPKKPRCLPGQMDLFESTRMRLENERAAQDELPAPFAVEE